MYPGQPDEDTIKKILAGDHHAATMLIRSTEKLVMHIVGKMVSNLSDRKDVMQDIYLKTFRYLPTFRYQCKLSTWVAKISYTVCMDYLKYKPEQTELPLIEDTTQEEPLATKEKALILEKISATLPPVYRTLITLFHKEELSIDEIMHITGLPEGTIKSYLYRARKLLKEKLLNHYSKDDL